MWRSLTPAEHEQRQANKFAHIRAQRKRQKKGMCAFRSSKKKKSEREPKTFDKTYSRSVFEFVRSFVRSVRSKLLLLFFLPPRLTWKTAASYGASSPHPPLPPEKRPSMSPDEISPHLRGKRPRNQRVLKTPSLGCDTKSAARRVGSFGNFSHTNRIPPNRGE